MFNYNLVTQLKLLLRVVLLRLGSSTSSSSSLWEKQNTK